MRQKRIMTATLTSKLGVIESFERSISHAGVDDTNLVEGKYDFNVNDALKLNKTGIASHLYCNSQVEKYLHHPYMTYRTYMACSL